MSDESDYTYLYNRRSDIRLRALANRFYHQERQRIFELRDGLVKAVAIFAGSVAFANVAEKRVLQLCAASITLSSAASLVFGFGSKARDSAKRTSEWILLERDMERAGERNFVEEQLNEWAARCNEIEVGEPAAHSGLWERCFQRACESMGSKPAKHATFFERHRPVLFLH